MKLKRAFTIVEVLVVIGIVAILTVIIFPSISNIRAKNRDTERVADLASIQLGLSLYYNQKGEYPKTLDVVETKYIPSDSLIGPNGEEYLYVPLTKGTLANPKCTYYQLGSLLELPSTQIDEKDTFTTLDKDSTSNGYKYCDTNMKSGINGTDSKMYSVRP